MPSPQIRRLTARLLARADQLYQRAAAGVPALPLSCRPGIFAAGSIYAGIGSAVARNGHDSITRRARTSRSQKLGWLALATIRTATTAIMPRPATLHAPPDAEVAFLVQAAARHAPQKARSEALLSVLAQLEARDRGLSA
jgi:phytoene synthase